MCARRVSLIALAVFVAATACAGDDEPAARPTTPQSPIPLTTPPEMKPPPCRRFIPNDPQPPVDGAAMPKGADALIDRVQRRQGIVQLTGFVRMTPRAFRKEYERRRDIRVLQSEDEIFEAELLLSTGDYRIFWKVSSVCRGGSFFVAVVAEEVDAEAVPSPTGTPSG